MRLLLTECKKLLAVRFLPILLLVLLLANFLLTLYTSQPYPWEEVVQRIWNDYSENPDEYNDYYASLEQIGKDNVREEPVYPVTYSENEAYNDYTILRHIMKRAAYLDSFPETVAKRIRTEERRISDLLSLGYSERTGTTRQVIAARDAYGQVLDEVELPKNWPRGYDTYLCNDIVCAFILIFVTIAAVQIFRYDRSLGFGPLLFTLRRGRVYTAAAKLGCLALTVVLTVLLFLGTTFLAVGLTDGYSSLAEPIQTFDAFSTVPDVISVGGFLLRQTVFRLAAFLLYSVIVAAIVCFGGGWIISLSCGLLFAALNCWFFYRRYLGTIPPIRYLNLASMAEGYALYEDYLTLRFGRTPIRTEVVLLCAVLALALLFAVLSVLGFCMLHRNVHVRRRSGKIRLPAAAVPRLFSVQTAGLRPLWVFELHKLRPVLVLVMLAAIVFARVAYLDGTVGSMAQMHEALYYQYIAEFAPISAEEREEQIRAERERIDGILSQKDSKLEQYLSAEINLDAYTAYLDQYADAFPKDSALERVEEYVRYLNRRSVDGSVAPIYDTGWKVYFNLAPDLFLCAAIVLFCTPIFSMEYISTSSSGGFARILRTTRRGRRDVFAAKIGLSLCVSVCLAILFRGISLWRVAENYLLGNLSAEIWRLTDFSVIEGGMSIASYLVLDFALQIVAGLLLAGLAASLSCLCRNLPAALSLALILVGIPYLITTTAIPQLQSFSLPEFTAPATFVCRTAEQSGSIWVLVLHLMLSVVLLLCAGKQYIRD